MAEYSRMRLWLIHATCIGYSVEKLIALCLDQREAPVDTISPKAQLRFNRLRIIAKILIKHTISYYTYLT